MFETLNRSSAEARQREEFLDVRDSVNRLDPVEERKLFLEVVTDWGVVERVAPYDPARLMVVVSRIFDPAIMSDIRICLGAARIAGYQLAGAVIAKVLTTELDNKDVKDLDHMWSAFRQAPSVYAHRGYDFDALSHTRRARQLIVNALLEGLQLRLEQMDGIAPDTDLVVKALIEIRDTDHVEIFAELEIQLDGLTRANRIVFLVKDLSSEDDYIAEAARRELQQLVNRKHVGLYRAMLKSDDPDVWGEGATLLGVLGIDSENERLLLEKWANLQRLSYTTLALLHSLGCVGGEATFEAILNMAPFSKGRIEKVSGLEKYILAALTGVVVRNPGLRGRAVDFLKPLLQSTRPAAIRVASVVALSYLYDADCDDILLDCAWQGFAGRDERPAKQARSEVNAIIMLKVEAIKALAQSTNPEVAHSIQQIIENLKQEDDLSGRTWIEWMGHTFNRVTTRKHASTRTLIFVAQRTLRAYDPQSAA